MVEDLLFYQISSFPRFLGLPKLWYNFLRGQVMRNLICYLCTHTNLHTQNVSLEYLVGMIIATAMRNCPSVAKMCLHGNEVLHLAL